MCVLPSRSSKFVQPLANRRIKYENNKNIDLTCQRPARVPRIQNVLRTLYGIDIFQNIKHGSMHFFWLSIWLSIRNKGIENHWTSTGRHTVKMTALCRSLKQFGKNLILSESNRSVSLSATARLREIIEKKEDKVLTIEGIRVPQKKEHLLLKLDSNACPLCAIGLDPKHTDVLILSQFVKSNGTMLPQKVTGLCKVQQKRMSILVTMAQKAGLLSDRFTKQNKNDSIVGRERRRFNTYYDEDTIRYKYKR